MPTITLDKNYNNKIGCEFLIHMAGQKKGAALDKSWEGDVTIKAEGTECKYELWDYVSDTVERIPSTLVMMCFGAIDRQEFYQLMYEKFSLHKGDTIGVYYFIKKA